MSSVITSPTTPPTRSTNLHQLAIARSPRRHRRGLRRAPVIDVAHLMHTTNRAARSAALLRQKLPFHISCLVLRQRYRRIPTLLAAIVHQTVLADIQVPPARPASPVVRLPIGDRLLEVIEPRIAPPRQVPHLVPNTALRIAQRLQLPTAIMNNSNRRTESQPQRPLA